MREVDLRCMGQVGVGVLSGGRVPPAKKSIALIDLSRARFIQPAGLVALAVFSEHQARLGRRPRLLAPHDDAVSNYLARMDLGSMVESFNGEHDLRTVRKRPHPANLLELRSFSSEEDVEGLATLIHDKLCDVDENVAGSLYESILELGVNVPHHAGRDNGYIAAQSTYGGEVVRFAVGDAGVGLRRSLNDRARDEHDALRMVMDGGVSSTGLTGRGQGIRSTRDCLLRVGGKLVAETGRAWTIQSPMDQAFRTSRWNVPGVIMQGEVDIRT